MAEYPIVSMAEIKLNENKLLSNGHAEVVAESILNIGPAVNGDID